MEGALRDPLVHLVTRQEYERWFLGGGGPISLCGLDLSAREGPSGNPADCVVCLDLQKAKRG